jgi:arylsulfatase A-like enzyme
MRFTQAITGGSWTQAAFPVIMTSTYASMYGGCLGPLAAERPAPVETLAAYGYRTAGFSTSPLLSREYGYQRGFEHFEDLIPGEHDPKLRQIKGGQFLLRQPITHSVSNLLGKQTRPARLYVPAAELTERVCGWLAKSDQPFFAWAHYMDVHWPYHLALQMQAAIEVAQTWRDMAHMNDANWKSARITPNQRSHYIRLYERAVADTDAHVGRLLDFIDASGLAENTIVIALADHGEEFLEHGRWGHWENNLHDEILRVPFILAGPGISSGQVIDRQVRTLDLMPTALDLCQVPPPDRLEGSSLAPLWNGSPDEYTPNLAISEMWRDQWHIVAVRTEAYKYIWDNQRPDMPELYHLQADPEETINLADQLPGVAGELHVCVDDVMDRMERTRPEHVNLGPQLDESMLARLRDLGYVE